MDIHEIICLNMEINAAQNIGGRLTMRALFFVVLVFEIYSLIVTTQGDFANNMLFYVQEQFNIFTLALLIILFTTAYFGGRNAGKEIIIYKRNYLLIGVKYSLLVLGIILSFLIIVYAANNAPKSVWQSLIWVLLRITFPIIAIWLWSAWRMKLRANNSK
jgi:hypothetical protein